MRGNPARQIARNDGFWGCGNINPTILFYTMHLSTIISGYENAKPVRQLAKGCLSPPTPPYILLDCLL